MSEAAKTRSMEEAWTSDMREKKAYCNAQDARYTEGWNDGFDACKLRETLAAPAVQPEPLSDAEIASLGEAHGLCTSVPEAGYRADALWFDGEKFSFARAIETTVLTKLKEAK